jgi:hypothetical protein
MILRFHILFNSHIPEQKKSYIYRVDCGFDKKKKAEN